MRGEGRCVRWKVVVPLEPSVVASPVVALTTAVGEEIALAGGAVAAVEVVAEDVALSAGGLGASPDELELLGGLSLVDVVVVDSPEGEDIEAHVVVKGSHLTAVAEGVDVPADGGANAELVVDELGTETHFVDDILVVAGSLIGHDPTAEVEFELGMERGSGGHTLPSLTSWRTSSRMDSGCSCHHLWKKDCST